jgi:signal transduction histidine kinase
MDINLVFRYATVYSFFALILGIPVCALAWWIQSQVFSSVLVLFATLFSPYLFLKLRSWLTAAVDQLPPFKGRYERLQDLKKYQDAIAQSQTVEDWACQAVGAIQELFSPESANVLVYDESVKIYLMKAEIGLEAAETEHLSLAAGDPVAARLTKDRNVAVRELLKQVLKEGDDEVISSMDAIHAELCLPLFIKGRLVSIVNVDRKVNKEMYNDLDLAALWGLARVAEETLRGILTRDELVKKERLATIGEMAAIVGHEIRTPLTVINSSIYVIEKKLQGVINDGMITKILGNMAEQVKSANKIIADILDYARNRDLILEKGSVNEALKKTFSKIEISKNIEVAWRLSDSIPEFMFDKEEIAQVFTNILHNALEAMPEGGALKIESALSAGEEVEIRFTDTGCGIPKENSEKIYEPLFTTKSKGTGLGMAVVKKAVDRHKGRIEIQSEAGHGATVIIRLPLTSYHVKSENRQNQKTIRNHLNNTSNTSN